MKPILVLATDSPEPSGMGTHMLALGTALHDRFEVAIAAPDDAAGLAFLVRAAERGLRIKTIALDRLDRFGDWLRTSGAALVHVHAGIGWEGHGLVRAGKAAGLPVVRTEHLPYLLTDVVQQAQYRAMLLNVDHAIAVSQAVFQSHKRQGGPKQSVVPNGIAPAPVTREARTVRTELGVPDAAKLVLTVARLTAQKGHMTLLGAVPAVLARQPEARFVLVGSGPETDAIKQAIAAQGLNERVHLLGQRGDVGDLLAAADLFVLPSQFEGLPLAVLEAMAAGVPVVATAIGGTREAIGDAHPFLVPPDDAPALAGAILAALEDGAAAATSAQARFAQRFTAERMAADTAKIYHNLLSPTKRDL